MNVSSTNVRFSKTQLSKTVPPGRFLFDSSNVIGPGILSNILPKPVEESYSFWNHHQRI